MERLSLILWRERELLESLLYRLEVEQLVLAGARSRWRGRSAQEVESLLHQLAETETLRASAADEAATGCGLAPGPSLGALADAVGDPWRSVLLDHRAALVAVTDQVAELAPANCHLVTSGYRSARDALRALEPVTRESGSRR